MCPSTRQIRWTLICCFGKYAKLYLARIESWKMMPACCEATLRAEHWTNMSDIIVTAMLLTVYIGWACPCPSGLFPHSPRFDHVWACISRAFAVESLRNNMRDRSNISKRGTRRTPLRIRDIYSYNHQELEACHSLACKYHYKQRDSVRQMSVHCQSGLLYTSGRFVSCLVQAITT